MDLIIFSLIMGFASFLQALTGFGIALIVVPISLLILDKTIVVVALVIVSIVLNGFLIKQIKIAPDKQLLYPLIISSAFGIPLGIWILSVVPINIMKIIVSILSIIFSIIFYKTKIILPKTKILGIVIGWLSGILQTSIGMSGPPVVLLLSNFYKNKDDLRKNLVSFFFFMNIIALLFFLLSSTKIYKGILYGIYVLPMVLIGAYIGNKIVKHVPQNIFRLLTFALVGLTGLYTLFTALK